MSEQYNGWTNRETWAAHLCITNDADLWRIHRGSSAADLRQDFENYYDRLQAGDVELVGILKCIGSLWRVNWGEVAQSLAGDTK